MKIFLFLSVLLVRAAIALPSPAITKRSSTSLPIAFACEALSLAFRAETFYPGSVNYTSENEHFWTPTDYSAPACVFTPKTQFQISAALLIFETFHAQFAVRGGGHMPISGYANIDGGILVGLTDLNQITLSSDKLYVSVGPGRRWEEVYDFLEPYGLVALGGRVGIVGVPGLLLGGGISFYSNQYGFASDNVIAFEVVLASGLVVEATSTSNAELFWALKGGGNSFGIVTRFDLLTYTSPSVCAGVGEYPSTEKTAFLSAVANFGQYGDADAKAAVIPSIFMLASLNTTVYTSALFYDGTECNQPALANFTSLPAIANSYGPTTLAKYISGTDALIPDGTRQVFQVISSIADASALEIVHDTFVEMVTTNIYGVAGLQASIAFQPVTKNFIQQGINKGGNPQGVDITNAPYFWMVENFSWTDPADDALINEFAVNVTSVLEAKLTAVCRQAQFKYMNDAGYGQEIFQNYGAGNLAKLQAIRTKYDPLGVFTYLMPGGWKVATA